MSYIKSILYCSECSGELEDHLMCMECGHQFDPPDYYPEDDSREDR